MNIRSSLLTLATAIAAVVGVATTATPAAADDMTIQVSCYGDYLIQQVNTEVRIAARIGDVRLLSELFDLTTSLLTVSQTDEHEAAIRRLRMTCLTAIGRLPDVRTEFERLTFLQDRRLGIATDLDLYNYPDLFRDSLRNVAAAALDHKMPQFAIEVVEQARVRMLAALGQGVAEHRHNAAPPVPEGVPLWLLDEAVFSGVGDLVQRQLTLRTHPIADDDLAALGVSAGLSVSENFETYFNWLVSAFDHGSAFTIAEASWPEVFSHVGWVDVQRICERAGPVSYQVVHGDHAWLIGIVAEDSIHVSPSIQLNRVLPTDGHQPADPMAEFWIGLLADWKARNPGSLRPLSVDIGGPAELACQNDAAYELAMARLGMNGQVALHHVPSIRLARSRIRRPTSSRDGHRLLHLGDATNTLIGPWLEAAYLAQLRHVDVRSLLGEEMTREAFDEHAAWPSIIVASCHGSFDDSNVLGTTLGVDTSALSLADLAASRGLEHIDLLLLASCEMGRRHDASHEHEALSVANASLVGGCGLVAAPARPVNDLVSALFVVEFARCLTAMTPAEAYSAALRALRNVSTSEFIERVESLWLTLCHSAIANHLPWPIAAVEPIFHLRLHSAAAESEWRSISYFLSGF